MQSVPCIFSSSNLHNVSLIMNILLYFAGHTESIVQMQLFSFVRMSEARSKRAVGGWWSKHRCLLAFIFSNQLSHTCTIPSCKDGMISIWPSSKALQTHIAKCKNIQEVMFFEMSSASQSLESGRRNNAQK